MRKVCVIKERSARNERTWSCSHSRVQVLIASTQRLGFISLGQMPACEGAARGIAVARGGPIQAQRDAKNHIHRGNSIHHMASVRLNAAGGETL